MGQDRHACGTGTGLGGRLLAQLDTESLTGTEITVPKNTHLYNCGDREDDLYLVLAGHIKTIRYSRDGKECLLSIHGPGDVLGEFGPLPGGRTETATAMNRAVLRRIPAARFRKALADEDLLEAFLAHVGERFTEHRQAITNLVTMDSERRLAALLLELAQKIGRVEDCGGVRISERITQEELSGMVGTTRSRVGYFLKGFCEAGMVRRTPESHLVVNRRSLSDYLDMCAS